MNLITKEFFKSSFGVAVKDLLGLTPLDDPEDEYLTYIDPATHATPDNEPWWYDQSGGGHFYFKWRNYKNAVDAYNRCPVVNAIVNRKAQAFINGWTWVLNSRDKEARDTEESKKIKALLDKPNPIQSRKQFEAQLYIYYQLFGFSIILPIKPAGFPNIDATSMWNIPASWIDFDATKENFTRKGGASLTEIVLTFNNSKTVFDVKDLIIIRDLNPSFSTLIFPGSKLFSLELPIRNIIGAYESRYTLITKRGPQGILSTNPGSGQYVSTPLTDPQKDDLQKQFRKYGLLHNQMQAIITPASLKWDSIGYSTKDLMLMEEVKESTIEVCSGLNFPPFLLGLADTTYNNMNEAHKGLYQNSIIPDGENIYEQLTLAFDLARKNLRLDKDFSKIPVLQTDKKTMADARLALNTALQIEYNQGLITLDEWLVELGRDPLPNGLGNTRATDPKNSTAPLATIIGVGGVQSLISVLTASGMSEEARRATVEIIFGISSQDAARMVAAPNPNTNGQQQNDLLNRSGANGALQEEEAQGSQEPRNN